MPRSSSSRTNPSSRELNSPLETATRTLDSLLQIVDSVEDDALEYARRAGFHGTTLEKIGLAVREIVNNAIIHGNRLDWQKKVIVRIARTTNQITITVWLVPQQAVSELQGSYQVAAVDGNDAVSVKSIHVGDQIGSLWVVRDGLNPGERVIVDGVQKVGPGMHVKPKLAQTPRPGN